MIEFINEILTFLTRHYALYLVVTMSIIVSLTICLLHFVKKPIKKLTAKIPNEKVRKLANKMFIILAFAFSAFAWFVLKFISPAHFSCEALEVLLTGSFAIVLYAFGDGIVTHTTAEKFIDELTELDKKDEKAEKKTTNAVKDFWNKVK